MDAKEIEIFACQRKLVKVYQCDKDGIHLCRNCFVKPSSHVYETTLADNAKDLLGPKLSIDASPGNP